MMNHTLCNKVKLLKISFLSAAISSLVACGSDEQNLTTATDESTSSSSESTTATSGTSSTEQVLCEYSYNEYNDSTSVQTTSSADWHAQVQHAM